jgi:hypothetical protein
VLPVLFADSTVYVSFLGVILPATRQEIECARQNDGLHFSALFLHGAVMCVNQLQVLHNPHPSEGLFKVPHLKLSMNSPASRSNLTKRYHFRLRVIIFAGKNLPFGTFLINF